MNNTAPFDDKMEDMHPQISLLECHVASAGVTMMVFMVTLALAIAPSVVLCLIQQCHGITWLSLACPVLVLHPWRPLVLACSL